MPNISGHGGGCCGARHISGFTTYSDTAVAYIERQWQAQLGSNYVNFSVEAILTDIQLASQSGQQWAKWLKDKGFVYVNRWRNSNSGNVCYRFIYTKKKVRTKAPPIMEIFNEK